MVARQVPRDIHEDARDMARRLMGTKRFLKSRDERKRVEMRFAHLKMHHGFERMRLRSPARVTNFTLPPSCRTSRRWRFVYSARQQVGCARRLRKWPWQSGRGVPRPGVTPSQD
jgi:hypothetical protein